MKSPSFSFYSADFLIGVSDLTNEEIGIYIKLLCFQHQKGHLTQKQLGLLLGFSFDSLSDELKSKFKIDENGMIFNARLEREIEIKSHFVDKQRENGKKGGRPKKGNNPNTNPNETQNKPKHKAKENPKKGIEDEIEIEDEIIIENKEKGVTGEKTEIAEVEVLDELSFEKIWALYERKGNRKTCERKWANLKNHCREAVFAHVQRYVDATPEIQYRKNFETYLNQECWNDEIIKNTKHDEFQTNSRNPKGCYSGSHAGTHL
ncbi:MAG: YdaU family protein [Bacteroidales bacterium]|jgi:uncharacterized protein YdaU (DUF1376 family)|nr:YdaU family protein [Bacteroidales bacterium]